MTIEAAMPLIAVSFMAWIMIVLPIVLLLGVAVAWLLGRRRTAADIERAHDAARTNVHGPIDAERQFRRK